MARVSVPFDVAERLVKAGLTLPAGSQVYNEAESRGIAGMGPQGQALVPAGSAALPREATSFGQWPFGPGIPIWPAPIGPRVPGSDQPFPRRSEYPVSWNLPGVGTPLVPWRVLRQAADVEMCRKCIELRKSEICYVDWDVTVKDEAVSKIAETTGANRYAARKELSDSVADEIQRVKAFFERPDRINDMAFSDWLSVALEEHFVRDTMNFYPWRTNGKDLHSFVVLAGDTLKPLLDVNGNRPQPPAPAIQQFIYGFPRGEFTDVSDADDEWAATDLVYHPKVRRSDSPYGMSPTETVLVVLDLWLKRQNWIRAEWQEGVMPEGWIKTSKEMTPERLVQWETVINELLAGSTAERHRYKVLPDGFDPIETTQFADKYKPEFDEFLVKLVCMCYDVLPMEIGFMPSQGLGGKGLGDAQEDTTYRRSLRPMFRWLIGILNDLAVRYLAMSPLLTFRFMGQEEEDETLVSNVRKEEQSMGVLTLNDRRAEKGLALFDFAEADMPLIVTPRGVIPFEGAASGPPPAPATGAGQPNLGNQGRQADSGQQPDQGDQGQQGTPAGNAVIGPSGSGAAPPAPSAQAEATKFLTFARRRLEKGAWRDFEFSSPLWQLRTDLNSIGAQLDYETLKLATAAALKIVAEGGEAVPKAPGHAENVAQIHDQVVKTAGPAIAKATGGLVDRKKLLADLAGIMATPRAAV